MTKEPNLLQRGLVWGIRIAIPKKLCDLRAQAGQASTQREIWRTTGKSDLSEARIEAARLKHMLLSQFRDETRSLEQLIVRREAQIAHLSSPRVALTSINSGHQH